MPNTRIAVWFDAVGPPKAFEIEHAEGKSGWSVAQHNGVDLLMIRPNERSTIRHAIPLSSVLYWTITADVGSGAPEWVAEGSPPDLRCHTCHTDVRTPDLDKHPNHDITRLCCNSDIRDQHYPRCVTLNTHPSKQGPPRVTYKGGPDDNFFDRPRGNSVTHIGRVR